ncbi:kinase-like domain-containing protein [Ilyonectria robusta]|uniref:kinase-like domain-containing protein n=1 Tax=Ilyonectria robusta TaxID=1079257 RepID=UPI001E8DBD16|nr:kinase-like domain-containing protein [Ilyonectria robusta]KAH8650416.1 kinase-like domain-containing protein [Ilyonectria robusta]
MPKAAPYDVLFVDRSHNYPDPLPTPNDIDGSEVLLNQSTGSRLIKMQQRFVIKFGIHVHPIEAHNMLYVAKSTTVPVPKVYAIYQRREKQSVVTYIVMQYVPGTTLLNLWGSLDQARKTAIARTLRTYFHQLRQLQHPGYFGNIAGGPPLDDMFSATQGAHEVKTSFATEDELIDCIIRIYLLETGERMAHKTRYYQHVLSTVLRGDGSPVFTHNDFQRKNVMVQPDGTLIIIDWEFASWYPTYWEYSTATYANGGWNDDWHEYVRMALDEYPNQSLWLSSMKHEMWT